MKLISLLAGCLFIINAAFGQAIIESKQYGKLEFIEIQYGVAQVVDGSTEALKNTPTGKHGWLKDFRITKVTDSVPAVPQANFGVHYVVKAKDTVNIIVEIEWIFPKKMKNDDGEKFKSIRYKTQRPTNIESASSYSLDKPYELIKGDWIVNFYIDNKKMHSRTFMLY